MKKHTLQLLAMAVLAESLMDDRRDKLRRWHPSGPEPRPCLNSNCGNLHFHNNSFCSAECCKAHRAAMRGEEG